MKIKENAILIVVGEGKERKKLEGLIKGKNLKEKIFLIGEIKDASKYLTAFDLFVLPSRYEGLSITLIEALFAQIPILASDVGGNKEIVGENCVFGNKKEFLEKIKESQFPKVKEKIFSLKNMVEEYLKIYQSL